MKLKVRIHEDTESPQSLFDFYSQKKANYSTDSGLDIVVPTDHFVPAKSHSYKIPLGIHVEPLFEDSKIRGCYLYPRSSTGSKTPLRLANSVGIIDYTYRGEIIACVDNLSDKDFKIEKGQRLFQICSPDLSPIEVEVCETLSETARQNNGYGSTGA
tara:strand:- start:6270 stop:6740 length:471 start_codon:yes stop_codon:yes gene_type:complete